MYLPFNKNNFIVKTRNCNGLVIGNYAKSLKYLTIMVLLRMLSVSLKHNNDKAIQAAVLKDK